MKAQYFSNHYGKRNTKASDWFDPILGCDTKLFVDPFNIYKESSGYWADAHSEIIQYFQHAFDLLAPVHDKPNAPAYKKVLHLMCNLWNANRRRKGLRRRMTGVTAHRKRG